MPHNTMRRMLPQLACAATSNEPLFDDLGTALWFSAGLLVVLFVIGSAVALAVVFRNERFRAGAAMRKVPASEIPTAIDGEVVRIVGDVVAGDTQVTAPLSGRECVFYQVVVTAYSLGSSTPGDLTSGSMVTASLKDAADECVGAQFYLRGSSGTARIVPDGAGAFFDAEEPFGSSDDEPLEPALRAFLDRHGLTGNRYTATESVLVPGMRVSVMGVAEWSGDRTELTLASTEERPLAISDLPDLLADT